MMQQEKLKNILTNISNKLYILPHNTILNIIFDITTIMKIYKKWVLYPTINKLLILNI